MCPREGFKLHLLHCHALYTYKGKHLPITPDHSQFSCIVECATGVKRRFDLQDERVVAVQVQVICINDVPAESDMTRITHMRG